ncbi:hypothetical protein [Streptomyces aidingensis]|uniref:Uncharacterized protein n=1 Tax=Streptomyces aidingensis TaxID=910347 RepID=A0A1I1GZ16_9ACTN|nr:hypothetical protein [Streptomyces aidingensis]SFC14413.1 hypothetical protein SAMN05421773_102114 [Streptomyces aidingensis]
MAEQLPNTVPAVERPRARRFARRRMPALAGLAAAALTVGALTACTPEEDGPEGTGGSSQEDSGGGNTADEGAEGAENSENGEDGENGENGEDAGNTAGGGSSADGGDTGEAIDGSAGRLEVGTDIPPGLYRSVDNDFCYWERNNGGEDEFESIIANGTVEGQAYVQIAETDVYFDTEDCGDWTPVPEGVTGEQATEIPGNGGTFMVGVDIAPGTYKSAGNTEECYWERLTDLSGSLDSIADNNFATGQAIVTIEDDDAFFTSNFCTDWVKQD